MSPLGDQKDMWRAWQRIAVLGSSSLWMDFIFLL